MGDSIVISRSTAQAFLWGALFMAVMIMFMRDDRPHDEKPRYRYAVVQMKDSDDA